MSANKLPDECESKEDVRVEIDRLDNALTELFAERHQYVTRMAALKKDPSEAFAPKRIEDVIARRRAQAETIGLDPDQVELMWRTLIEWNINFEKGIIHAQQKIGQE